MTYTYVVEAVDNSTGQVLTPAVSGTITIQGGSQSGGYPGQTPSNNVDNSTSPGTPTSPGNSPTTPGNQPGLGNSPTPGNSTGGQGEILVLRRRRPVMGMETALVTVLDKLLAMVVETTPEPEAVVETTPEPEAVVETTPEPEAVVETTPEPEAVVETTPEPEAVVEMPPVA